jgi:hypothetical protein
VTSASPFLIAIVTRAIASSPASHAAAVPVHVTVLVVVVVPAAMVKYTAMEFTDVNAPEPVSGIPPWRDPQWIAEADAWIDEACERSARRRSGPVTARARMYSVVARVPTDQGIAWFKASPPMSGFEPALLAALARWHPGQFAAPLATDLDRAWSLARDGGQTLRERQERDPDPTAWPRALRRYVELQQGLAGHVGDLLALGLADLRPQSAPAQFERLLASPATERSVGVEGGISHAEHEGLRNLAPQLAEWCAELRQLGVPASLDHADVHPGNIFADAAVPFDWGDSAVAHPFCSLWIALRTAAEQTGLDPRSAQMSALADAFFAPWLEAGHPEESVYRSLQLALRIAPLARALTWGRVFPCFQGHPVTAAYAARSLAALLKPDPLAN